MLTHPLSKALYSKLASAPAGWAAQNMTLVAKSALLVYRKCGRREAQVFIDLVRVGIIAFDW